MLTKQISCIILAGGKGSRMGGEDKGLVELNGQPLIEHVIARVRPQVDDIVISANRNQEIYQKYSSRVIADRQANYSGPMAGIASALPECNHEHTLVVPCDMPALPQGLVAKLLTAMQDHTVCIARQQGRLQLVFIMQRSLLDNINKSLQRGHNKLMQWIEQQLPIIVEFDTSEGFYNINTRDDLNSHPG